MRVGTNPLRALVDGEGPATMDGASSVEPRGGGRRRGLPRSQDPAVESPRLPVPWPQDSTQMALLSLWGTPPGVLLAAGGVLLLLVPGLRAGRWPGLIWLAGALVALVRLLSGAASGGPGFFPATLAGAGPLVSVATGLLGAAILYGIVLFEGRRRPVPSSLGGVCVLAGLTVAGLFASSLSAFLCVVVGAQLMGLLLRPGGIRSWLRSGGTGPLSILAALGSGALLFQGWRLRAAAEGADVHDWVGTPFRGDAPSSLIFCGLALPVLLPGIVGGFTHGFLGQRQAIASKLSGDSGSEFRPTGSGLPSICVGALLLGGLYKQFNGAEALGAWGIAAAGFALLAGGFAGWFRSGPKGSSEGAQEPPNDKRLASLVQGVSGLMLVGASAASESSEAAFGFGLIAALPAIAGLALASARLTHERGRHSGIGPRGMGRIFPSTMIFSGILTLSLLAFPCTLGFLARSQGLGSLLVADGEAAGITALAFGTLLALLVALPLLHGLFLRPGASGAGSPSTGSQGDEPPPRPLEPRSQRASLGLAAALVVAFGVAPDGLAVVVPFANTPAQTFPSPALQLGLLGLAAIVFGIWTRFRSSHFDAPSASAPGYPPAP